MLTKLTPEQAASVAAVNPAQALNHFLLWTRELKERPDASISWDEFKVASILAAADWIRAEQKRQRKTAKIAKENGKSGGRPRLPDDQLSPAALAQRKWRAKQKAE